MSQSKTSVSLLLRIRDSDDREAWEEFSNIYRPAIVGWARQKGLQNADAEDLAQQVLIKVAKSIPTWEHDPQRATFRTWLNRVTHNAALNAITRAKPDRASGNSKIMDFLNESTSNDQSCEMLTIEIRREVFRYAANEIQPEFQPNTWSAFWLTSVDGHPVDEIASQLGKNPGSIYAARSRVMRRLKAKIEELQILEGDQSW